MPQTNFGPNINGRILVRGKYIERLRKGSNVVVLDPEVADLFPNADSVNAALRALAEIAKRAGTMQRRSG